MKLNRFTVSFEEQDSHFLKKCGRIKGAAMVRKHYKKYNLPFINDSYQLAALLGDLNKNVFKLTRNIDNHYKSIIIPKRNGGTRILNVPDGRLKFYQRKILSEILSKIPISKFAMAYVAGKTLKDNATPHVKHKYLLKMDITDFFGSITFLNTLSTAFNSNIYPPHVGVMLTTLCCKDGVLPQGAPTSPALSNIVMKNFDDIIGNWCKKRNITYTRYCDDLTFSADFPLCSNVYPKVIDMLNRRGFMVNESKTRFVSNFSCQRVTGLTVNQKVSIPIEYKKQLRQEIYYALKFGLADSILRANKTEYMCNGIPNAHDFYNHLNGKLNYVLQIEPQNKWFKDKKEQLKLAHTRCT